jgi:hypothetical protein
MNFDLKNRESVDLTQVSTSVGPSRTSAIATRRLRVGSAMGSVKSNQSKKRKHHQNFSLHHGPNEEEHESFLTMNNSIQMDPPPQEY